MVAQRATRIKTDLSSPGGGGGGGGGGGAEGGVTPLWASS